MTMNKDTLRFPLLFAAAITVSACLPSDPENNDGDDDNNDTPVNSASTLTVDASDSTQWAYVDLATGTTVTESDDWHILLKRYDVLAHNDTDLALVASQDDFYNGTDPLESAFVNATAESELSHLTDDIDVSSLTFEQPSNSYVIEAGGESFYDYNISNHKLYANDDAVWVIRSNTGNSYAKLRPTVLFDDSADSGNGAYEVASFELHLQGSDDTEFSAVAQTWTIELTASVGHECYDIDAGAEVDCTNDDWDIQFNFNPAAYLFELTLNGGVSGTGSAASVYTGHFDSADTDKLVSGIQTSAEDAFSITAYHYASDSQTSVFTDNTWYAYNLQGQHGIWPNYRVYAITKDDATFFVQIVNYYNDQAESGHITLRYRESD